MLSYCFPGADTAHVISYDTLIFANLILIITYLFETLLQQTFLMKCMPSYNV